MIQVLTAKLWNGQKSVGLEGLIQQQNEQMLLTYLLAVSVNDSASFATKAGLLKAIDDLKTKVTAKLKKPRTILKKDIYF